MLTISDDQVQEKGKVAMEEEIRVIDQQINSLESELEGDFESQLDTQDQKTVGTLKLSALLG